MPIWNPVSDSSPVLYNSFTPETVLASTLFPHSWNCHYTYTRGNVMASNLSPHSWSCHGVEPVSYVLYDKIPDCEHNPRPQESSKRWGCYSESNLRTVYTYQALCSAQTRTGIGHLRKPPGVELIPCRRKPLRRTRTLRGRNLKG